MVVIPPNMAKLVGQFNGINGYPKLSNKYIGVLLKKKGKGIGESDEEFEDLIEGDYYRWERPYLDYPRWADSHESKPTRVYIEDIKNNQDQFVLFATQADMISQFNEIQPKKDSLYIRSHPGPWTKEMEVQEDQVIKILEHFGMYYGPQLDCLAELYLHGRKRDLFSQKGEPIMHRMHQLHVTGHMNRDETREAISRMNKNTIIVPYHSMRPLDFIEDVAEGKRVYIPKIRERYTLEGIRNGV
jgi:hypothetical protein